MNWLAETCMLSYGWRRALWLLLAGAIAGLSVPPLFIMPALFVGFPIWVWCLDGVEVSAGLRRLVGGAFSIGFYFGLGYFLVEEIRAAAALPDNQHAERVLNAFFAVPREDHVGPGPWLLRSPLFGMASRRTVDTNPAHLYHNVLIALDEQQGINIGEPSMWARLLSRTAIEDGASILQIGAGSGYYSVILSEIVGDSGQVLAMETDKTLADMATRALSTKPNVTVRHANGATDLNADDGPFDLIVAFAGVTHPVTPWIDCLKPNGRLLLPITGESWWGAMVLATRNGEEFDAVTLGRCAFFPCVGARDAETAKRIDLLWSEPSRLYDKKLMIQFGEHGVRYKIDDHEY